MSDFITLICPNCGGRLQITPSTSSLLCQNCGNEHLVRRDAGNVTLETFAKCPKCNRNDRVEKVSGVVRDGTQKLNGSALQTSDYRDHDGRWHTTISNVPFTGTQETVLAQRLSPPKKPELNNGKNWSWVFYIGIFPAIVGGCFPSYFLAQIPFFAVALLMGLGMKASGVDPTKVTVDPTKVNIDVFSDQLAGMLGLSFILIYIIYIVISTAILWKIGNHVSKKYIASLPKKKALYDEKMNRWNNAMQIWQRLYYCKRDDGVFIPGENTLIPSENIQNYIYGN